MEEMCILCQAYKDDIGHVTSTCPNVTCKKCNQKGHFKMNCENDDETESKMSIEDDNSKKEFIKIKELKNLQDMEKEDIRISNMIEINV